MDGDYRGGADRAVFSGGDALSVCIEGCTSAVTVCFGLCAVYCLWLGVFRVAEQCGVIDSLSRLLRPVIKALFGCVSPQAEKSIALNLASNVVGAGNAATPSAVQALAHTEKGKSCHAREPCCLCLTPAACRWCPPPS